MTRIALVIAIVIGLYFYFTSDSSNPEVIENPVYSEIRITVKTHGRTLQHVMYGEMVDEADCNGRALIVWTNVFSDCPQCTFEKADCRESLPTQYARMYADQPIDTTYLRADRGNRHERSGRLVIWGLTGEESIQVCEATKAYMQKNYQGEFSA